MIHRPGRRTFSENFRKELVRTVVTSGRSVASVAADVAITPALLHKWRREYEPEVRAALKNQAREKAETVTHSAPAHVPTKPAGESISSANRFRAKLTAMASIHEALEGLSPEDRVDALRLVMREFGIWFEETPASREEPMPNGTTHYAADGGKGASVS
jgi:transposase-like protein